MNQKMVELLGEYADKYPKVLEEFFPHVFDKLIELWGKDEMHAYLDELMMSNRPDRKGFPDAAAAEVWEISSVYAKQYPPRTPLSPIDGLWSNDTDAARDAWKDMSSIKREK
jgi:hypothetical protein